MATRKTRDSAAIAESAETPVVGIPTDTDTQVEDTQVEDTQVEDTETALTYTVHSGGVADTRTVEPGDIESLATGLGAGKGARIVRILRVGRFIGKYAGMTANAAHKILGNAGHAVHRDTVNVAANAYSLAAEFIPAETLDAAPDDGTVTEDSVILAECLSLVESVGIRAIKGTHGRISVIDYDRLVTVTEPTARATEFTESVRAAIAAGKGHDPVVIGKPATATGKPKNGDSDSDSDADSADSDSDSADSPVSQGDQWATALDAMTATLGADSGQFTPGELARIRDAALSLVGAIDRIGADADADADLIAA